jgi:hypothetical protein
MVLNPILLGGVWFIIHRYSVVHTFIWKGWVGGLVMIKGLSMNLYPFKITDTFI